MYLRMGFSLWRIESFVNLEYVAALAPGSSVSVSSCR
jgi:hypothetical protein